MAKSIGNTHPRTTLPASHRTRQAMPNKIGDKEVLFTGSFLAKDDEQIQIDVPVADASITVRMKFVPKDEKDQRVEWHAQEDRTVDFTFLGWKSPFFTTMDPAVFAHLNDRPLMLQASAAFVGINILTVLVLLGPAKPNE